MSNINNSLSSNKEGKSSKIVIVSKNRIESAKDRVNYITLKEGDLKITMQMTNDNINKQNINNEINNIKQQILINSKSYGVLSDNPNINKYYKKKKLLITPNRHAGPSIKKNPTTNNNYLYTETMRTINLLKTTENNRDNSEEDDEKKMETIFPYENNDKKSNIIIKSVKNTASEKNSIIIDNENKKKEHGIEVMNLSIKDELENDNNNNANNNNNKENLDENNNEKNDIGIISRNYFNSIKNNNRNDIIFDKYKSEEIKFMNSNSSRDNRDKTNFKKTNNYIERNNQRSDKTAKSISEPENENKNKIVSKLVLDSLRTNNGDNNNGQRLITEYDYQYINENDREKNDDDLISESKSSDKTIKIKVNENNDENDQNNKENKTIEENDNIIYNDNNDNIYQINNDNINKNEVSEKNEKEKKNSLKGNNTEFLKLKNEIKDENQKIQLSRTLNIKKPENLYRICHICEQVFPITKVFIPECNIHIICKKCAKNYYEDIIENGDKELLCPFVKCKELVDLEYLKKIISAEHFNILKNNKNNSKEFHNKLYLTKIKTNIDNENIKLYSKKHVIDINTNKNFYNYYNTKETNCPICFNESLFSKTNRNFFKCLNCSSRICKYCYKEYEENHFDLNSSNHCKVYFRFDEEGKNNRSFFEEFLLQMFFVFSSYFICLISTFLLIREKFINAFHAKTYWIFYLCVYLFTLVCFMICVPFIAIFYPYFPSIMAMSDY